MGYQEIGNGWSDVYVGDSFDDNALFLSRIFGNPQPVSRALGALVLDVDQAALLLQVIEEYEKAYEIERKGQTMLNHTHDTLSCLHSFLANIKIEPAV